MSLCVPHGYRWHVPCFFSLVDNFDQVKSNQVYGRQSSIFVFRVQLNPLITGELLFEMGKWVLDNVNKYNVPLKKLFTHCVHPTLFLMAHISFFGNLDTRCRISQIHSLDNNNSYPFCPLWSYKYREEPGTPLYLCCSAHQMMSNCTHNTSENLL